MTTPFTTIPNSLADTGRCSFCGQHVRKAEAVVIGGFLYCLRPECLAAAMPDDEG